MVSSTGQNLNDDPTWTVSVEEVSDSDGYAVLHSRHCGPGVQNARSKVRHLPSFMIAEGF